MSVIPNLVIPSNSNPLPNTINPPVVASVVPPNSPVNNSTKRFVVIHTKDIDDVDFQKFSSQGKAVKYDVLVESNNNIDVLIFDYLFIDLRVATSRAYFDAQDVSNYNVVAYIDFFEKFDSYTEELQANNVLSTFPPATHFKAAWDASLLQQPTSSPTKCLSVINFAMNFLKSLGNSSVRN